MGPINMSPTGSLLAPTSRCTDCSLRNNGICCELADEHLHELSSIMSHRHFTAGSEIIHQDDTSELFAIVMTGTIKLTRMLEDGRQQIVGLLSTTDCLGSLYSGTSHDSAECVTDVTLCSFPCKKFEAVLEAHPELQHRLLLRTMKDLDDAREWVLALGQKNAGEKSAMFLVWLVDKQQWQHSNRSDPGAPLVLQIPFTRHEIGNFLGLTLETVSRQFSKLKRAGVIGLPGAKLIEIKDVDALRCLAVQDA